MLLEHDTRRIFCVRVDKGRRHDFRLFKESRVRVHPSVPIDTDTGYQGLQKLHANHSQTYQALADHRLKQAARAKVRAG